MKYAQLPFTVILMKINKGSSSHT